MYFVDPDTPLLFPPLADCDPASDTLAIDVLAGPSNFCSAAANRMSSMLDNADLKLEMFDDQSFAPIEVLVRDPAQGPRRSTEIPSSFRR